MWAAGVRHSDRQSTGVAGGNQLQYSVLTDYSLSHRTNLYAGFMFSKFSDVAFVGSEWANYIYRKGHPKRVPESDLEEGPPSDEHRAGVDPLSLIKCLGCEHAVRDGIPDAG
jgi:hypothetical protein